jgi:hypothetical protein
MPDRTLLTGPRYPTLEAAAFADLAASVQSQPNGVCYLARTDHAAAQTDARWQDIGRPQTLQIDTFDGLVADCYETAQYAGRVTHIDQPLRDRLVELAVERLPNSDNPLATPDALPAAGLCQQVEAVCQAC